jgi:Protein of unknown function (DUF3037)
MSGERYGFEYAVLRVVPRVDRGEMVNAGVLLYCRPRHYLAARVALDPGRVLAIDPAADIASIERALAAVLGVCDQRPAAGPAGQQETGRRFRWLTAARSTVVQPGPVHTGLTQDPDAEAERLLAALVLPPQPMPPENAT